MKHFTFFIGAIGAAQTIWNLLDNALAAMAIPNIIALILLSNETIKLKKEFFTSPEFYLADVRKKDKKSAS